jgi:ribosome-associated translation inhibitor RaiA
MNSTIVSEHFDLTAADHGDMTKYLAKLQRLLPDDCHVRVFLALDKDNHYRALCKARVRHEDLVAEKRAYDLHTAVSGACEGLRKRIIARKSKANHLRRKQHEVA